MDSSNKIKVKIIKKEHRVKTKTYDQYCCSECNKELSVKKDPYWFKNTPSRYDEALMS